MRRSQPLIVPVPASPVAGTRFRLAEVVETTSTNADLSDFVRVGERPFLALRSDFQSRGRGRRNRTWEAPPKSGLMMSVLFPSDGTADLAVHAHRMASCLGLAALKACLACNADVSMKWPNDLVGPALPDGTLPKLAGVLGEIVASGSESLGVLVGIGLNLRPVPDRTEELGRSVVVLDDLTEVRIGPTEMAVSTLKSLEAVLVQLEEPGGPERLRQEMVARSAVIGRDVEMATDGAALVGVAVDIDADGRLVVETASGRQAIAVGDVVSARVRS